MGRVNSASYLKDRIAFRDKSFEIGYYEELRWTEKPEAYLRRALSRALFEEQGVRQIVAGPGTTLDVDLDAFQELRFPRHAARMRITWVLRDDAHRYQYEETFTIGRPIPDDEAVQRCGRHRRGAGCGLRRIGQACDRPGDGFTQERLHDEPASRGKRTVGACALARAIALPRFGVANLVRVSPLGQRYRTPKFRSPSQTFTALNPLWTTRELAPELKALAQKTVPRVVHLEDTAAPKVTSLLEVPQ